MTPARLHTTLWVSGLAGLSYFGATALLFPHGEGPGCPIRWMTGYPCPSCGVTRALLLLSEGQFTAALTMNPLGILVAVVLLVLPALLLSDRLRNRHDTYRLYRATERFVRRPPVFLTLLTLTLLNWIWNLCKFP